MALSRIKKKAEYSYKNKLLDAFLDIERALYNTSLESIVQTSRRRTTELAAGGITTCLEELW